MASLPDSVPITHVRQSDLTMMLLNCGAAMTDIAVFGALGVVIAHSGVVRQFHIAPWQPRVLILGTAAEAAMAAQALAQSRIPILGFYQTDPSSPIFVPQHQVVPGSESLKLLVELLRIQIIVVAVSEQRGGALPMAELLNCRLSGVIVTYVSSALERMIGRVPIELLKHSWFIYGSGFSQAPLRRIVKRVFDVATALILLVLLAPLMLLVAIAVLLESGRPIIFRQERVGHGGRNFSILKFRSMRVDAEKDGVPQWASDSDPRITRVGRFIRRTRIDELPQILNVLRGDMSFVGPRPERPFFVAQLSKQLPFYDARHSVKPGISGWAQVCYRYGASAEDAARKLEFDLFYVKNHSLLLDLLILAKSVRVVLSGWGAR